MSHTHKHHGKPHDQPPQEPPTAASETANGENVPLAKLEQEKAELVARLQRTTADFQNYQKRAARERLEAGQFAVGEFVKQLLPIVDNLERALEVPSSHPDAQTLKDGVKIVYDQVLTVLAARQIRVIDAAGGTFDPAIHNALMQQPSDQPAMTVLQVVQKGYEMNGQTLRAARVIVSAGPAQPPAEEVPAEEMPTEKAPPAPPGNDHRPSVN